MLDKLILNTPETLEIPELSITLKVKEPTRKERILAKSEAVSNNKTWAQMDEQEKNEELFMRLLPMIIVEPKITYDDLNAMPESTRAVLIRAVSKWWAQKLTQYKLDIENF